MKKDTFSFDMAQTLRRSHCDRKDHQHECAGTMTIKRGEVCLSCPLCGDGNEIPDWSYRLNILLGPVFKAAGIDWDSLGVEAKVKAFKAYKRTQGSEHYAAVSPRGDA